MSIDEIRKKIYDLNQQQKLNYDTNRRDELNSLIQLYKEKDEEHVKEYVNQYLQQVKKK